MTACAEGAIEIRGGKARLVAETYCDGLGACLGECPQDAIRVIEREADAYSEELVPSVVPVWRQSGACRCFPVDVRALPSNL